MFNTFNKNYFKVICNQFPNLLHFSKVLLIGIRRSEPFYYLILLLSIFFITWYCYYRPSFYLILLLSTFYLILLLSLKIPGSRLNIITPEHLYFPAKTIRTCWSIYYEIFKQNPWTLLSSLIHTKLASKTYSTLGRHFTTRVQQKTLFYHPLLLFTGYFTFFLTCHLPLD